MSVRALTLAALAAAALAGVPPAQAQERGAREPGRPLVIAHRGASGYLPEHTLEAYELAVELGADYIEPDLVATKDGVLVARHEPNLINTTNVKDLPRFADRRRTMTIDGKEEEGFFASDFTWAELREHVRAVQPLAERDAAFNGRYRIARLEEVIELAQRKGREQRRTIGIYPETKHAAHHRALGLALEEPLLQALQRRGWNRRDAPVFIQSFEPASLQALRGKTKVRLVQLIGGGSAAAQMLTPQGLADVRRYADGIGPWKGQLLPTVCILPAADANGCADANGDGRTDDADRKLQPATTLMAQAKALGLFVHPYTFRNEARRLASDFAGNPIHEYLAFYELGVDGVFSDFPDTALTARALWARKR
jgi:glycerophosphoryl diester phosphodiesterase